MGNDNKEEIGKVTPARQQVYDFAGTQRDNLFSGPTGTESEFIPLSQNFYNAGLTGMNRSMEDYGGIMSGYGDWRTNMANPLAKQIADRQPRQFTFQNVQAPRVSGESLEGYRTFANTGGYSGDDIRDLRARGISPIRSAYGNTMQNLSRSQSLSGGSPNYVAAVSRAQRELPQQLADATQNVNAQLAESIRSGKLAGLAGMTGITEAEGNRSLQANLANQQADLRAQELTESGMSAREARQIAAAELSLKGLEGQRSLYSSTPGLASTFGNQALQAYNQRANLDQIRNNYGLGLIGSQLDSLGQQAQPGKPWWQTAIDVGTSVIPFI